MKKVLPEDLMPVLLRVGQSTRVLNEIKIAFKSNFDHLEKAIKFQHDQKLWAEYTAAKRALSQIFRSLKAKTEEEEQIYLAKPSEVSHDS